MGWEWGIEVKGREHLKHYRHLEMCQGITKRLLRIWPVQRLPEDNSLMQEHRDVHRRRRVMGTISHPDNLLVATNKWLTHWVCQ